MLKHVLISTVFILYFYSISGQEADTLSNKNEIGSANTYSYVLQKKKAYITSFHINYTKRTHNNKFPIEHIGISLSVVLDQMEAKMMVEHISL